MCHHVCSTTNESSKVSTNNIREVTQCKSIIGKLVSKHYKFVFEFDCSGVEFVVFQIKRDFGLALRPPDRRLIDLC